MIMQEGLIGHLEGMGDSGKPRNSLRRPLDGLVSPRERVALLTRSSDQAVISVRLGKPSKRPSRLGQPLEVSR